MTRRLAFAALFISLLGVSACDSRSGDDADAVCPGSRNCPDEG